MVKSIVSKLSSSSPLTSSTSPQYEAHNGKNRNDPGRFFGDGVQFKAKLIGILEVGEARGDRMCQEALQDLKIAIRAAGEHKQRITIHVTIDGLRLRDEKTSDSLYHHPVHKISFIAQDMTDSRAFGYIFGSPDSGHRFFGIKTDKAASQVVLAMRDLFQVVFELKKKEIELARQQIQSKTIHEHQPLTLSVKNISTNDPSSGLSSSSINKISNLDNKTLHVKEMSPESVADLVDLEQELSSLQRGITQMERITPSEPLPTSKNATDEDPFGDSFTNFPTYHLLPPPESTRSRHLKPNKPCETTTSTTSSITQTTSNTQSSQATKTSQLNMTTLTPAAETWLNDLDKNDVFDTVKAASLATAATTSPLPMPPVCSGAGTSISVTTLNTQSTIATTSANVGNTTNTSPSPSSAAIALQSDDSQKSDLDPLGTGRIRPYIDKKYFFQDLKNPPKKILKDLSGPETGFAAQFNPNTPEGGNDVPIEDLKPVIGDVKYDSSDKQTTDDHATNPVMLPRDTDPFSPTRKKSDPFQDGDIFGRLDPFEFEYPSGSATSSVTEGKAIDEQNTINKEDVFNGPLQVNLPPESSWIPTNGNQIQRRVERQTSESPTAGYRNRPSVFKQNTVDVISSISSKKMPHLFGQKFSKRDSNSINMRRLQESDSLSENETAPEPPPRPDSATHAEPPPLPPKKQFSDIIIRPRTTPSPSNRYESISSSKLRNTIQDVSVPPIPLPSRRVGKSEGTYPGPGRPRKPGNDDDYLHPITGPVPPLLPPPQAKGRLRRNEIYENKADAVLVEQLASNSGENQDTGDAEEPSILPDITLSQLLTLGIDELATKLNVPTSKLSTMTLVELTAYLSEFIEKSKKPKQLSAPLPESNTPIFKVNFNQDTDATFVAKFDDNFGEEPIPFVANFSQFSTIAPEVPTKPEESSKSAAVPPADRYAAFREIIDQELHQGSIDQSSSPDVEAETQNIIGSIPEDNLFSELHADENSPITVPVTKIDTKITEAISHAKDRYAALRDIILVEDLFEKPEQQHDEDLLKDFPEFGEDFNLENIQGKENQKTPIDSSPDSIQNEDGDDQMNNKKELNKFGQQLTLKTTTKDDSEIDEFMNRAISNLSLDSREHLSPNSAITKSPANVDKSVGSPQSMRLSPATNMTTGLSSVTNKSQFNDMSTSPIPLQKSPIPLQKSPMNKSPLSKSPIPQLAVISNLIDASKHLTSGSLSDVVCGSSPDGDTGLSDAPATKPITSGKSPKSPKELWTLFDKSSEVKDPKHHSKTLKTTAKSKGESPCSSDGKEDWNHPIEGDEYHKRWPKGHTSSSSRDLSPWDDEASDYKKKTPPAVVGCVDRQGYYMRHARRMNSCDEDYDYEEGMTKRRERRIKPGISRSRENFEFDFPQWYHVGPHHNWSPEDDDERHRAFERGSYDRNSYGPPIYDKRDHKMPIHIPYDRRDYKSYDKRKYYRDYIHSNYDFESYGECPEGKERKIPPQYYGEVFEKIKPGRRDYENIYEEGFAGGNGPRSYRSREYMYERDRKSFDRESIESYENAGRRRKSFGSGDVYGSLESREEFRERYIGGPEKTRSLRKGMKIRIPPSTVADPEDAYDQDSEVEPQLRRVGSLDTRSLQRPGPGSQRIRKSSGSSPWDGEDHPSLGHGQKGWKRPSSASESERRLGDCRRTSGNTPSGSDGEKDRRLFRKKQRSRSGKEAALSEPRQPARYGTSHRDNYDYINYDDYEQPTDEDKFERLNRRRHEMHQRMIESERRQKSTNDKYKFNDDDESPRYICKKESNFYSEKIMTPSQGKHDEFQSTPKSIRQSQGSEFDFDNFQDTPRSNTSSKFNFEEQGFESDFNSPPLASCTSASTNTPATKSSFRFSNDFSDKDKHTPTNLPSGNTFDSEFSPVPTIPNSYTNNNTTTGSTTQKLRFDDRITISKFENDETNFGTGCCDDAFEDDFSKAQFDFEKEDQWNPEPQKKNNRINSKLQQRQDMIKKSESINIFARKTEDPFEDDEFFKSPGSDGNDQNDEQNKATNGNGNTNDSNSNGGSNKSNSSNFQWESNFAKFDENM